MGAVKIKMPVVLLQVRALQESHHISFQLLTDAPVTPRVKEENLRGLDAHRGLGGKGEVCLDGFLSGQLPGPWEEVQEASMTFIGHPAGFGNIVSDAFCEWEARLNSFEGL